MPKLDWTAIAREYVEGVAGSDGQIRFPTLREVADRHGLTWGRVRQISGRQKWTEQRSHFVTRREQEHAAARSKALAGAATKFDAQMSRAATSAAAIALRELRRCKPDEVKDLLAALKIAQEVGRIALGLPVGQALPAVSVQQSIGIGQPAPEERITLVIDHPDYPQDFD